eukprot:g5497.t1
MPSRPSKRPCVKNIPEHPNSDSLWLGAHVSMSGGVENAVKNAHAIQATAFALFTRSQRKWTSPALTEESIKHFKDYMREYNYSPDQVVPHGSYLLNCASPSEELLEKSRAGMLDEVRRCERLGLKNYNFHPGSTTGKGSVEDGTQRITESINLAHRKTKGVTILIENMCRQGHTIDGTFEELRAILLGVKDQSRVGVCFDTCHAFAAGYDLSTEKGYHATLNFAEFDRVIGLKYLKAFHLNDSKGELGCRQDRHENIGKGKIGSTCFALLVNDARFSNIPMILETPKDCDEEDKIEIEKVRSLLKPISRETGKGSKRKRSKSSIRLQ